MDNYKIAVASSDGIVVNQHFGRASKFYIYEVKGEDTPKLKDVREVAPVCESGEHDEGRLEENMRALSDCQYMLVLKIGPGAEAKAISFGIDCYVIPGLITESIEHLRKYLKGTSIDLYID